MKPYLTFSAEDLACDADFLKWVKYPGHYPELDIFWRHWLRENAHKREVVEEARQMILAVVQENQFLPDKEKERAVWKRIAESAGLPRRKQVSLWQRWYSQAAVVLLTLGIGWFVSQFKAHETEEIASAQRADPEYVTQINNADVQKMIILSDGTSIILQPHSTLGYPESFKPDVRQVFLTGEAFFEVARDSNRPFLVQAGELVTRVLGTSFMVRNVEGENKVLVQVRTGKVSVFRANAESRPLLNSDKKLEGVVLMPNQQVLYEPLEMKMTKSLVENPAMLIPEAKHGFEFVDTPIKDVFKALEEAYGVDIVFDEEALSTCYLNASLNDVPLYEKLKLICKGINTTYEVLDSHIIVYGSGCNEETANPK